MATTWQDRCRALGGVATRFPSGPNMGQDACRVQVSPGKYEYRAANKSLGESLNALATRVTEAKDRALGAAVETRDDVVKATGLDKGAIGVAGKLLGIPPVAVLAIALGAGYLLIKGARR